MSKLLFASQNKGKQKEVARIFSRVENINLVFPDNFPELKDLDPEETGETFHDNAELKARAWLEKIKISVVAEDTGLQVNALGKRPGIHSKRFFPGSDADRNKEILRQLEGVNDRSAQFITVACLLEPGKDPRFFEGIIRGTISDVISKGNGFGYDPIFIPKGYDKSFAELGTEVKNTLSSRAKAINQVVDAVSAS